MFGIQIARGTFRSIGSCRTGWAIWRGTHFVSHVTGSEMIEHA